MLVRTFLREWIQARCDTLRALVRTFVALKTGTIPLNLGLLRLEITQDPKRIHEILVAEWNSFPKTRLEHRVLEPVMDGGLILLQGEKWKEHRGALASVFTPNRLQELPSLVATAAIEQFSKWPSTQAFTLSWSDEARAILNHAMCSYFLNLARFSDSAELARRLELAGREFALVEAALETRVTNPLWRLFSGTFLSFSRAHHALGRVTALIREGSQSPPTQDTPSRCPFHALTSLLSESIPDHDERTKELQTLYGAGATTMHLLAWCADLLARNPTAQDRLRAEILEFARTNPTTAETSVTALEQLDYLSAVLYETLRLYPPAPFLVRHARNEGRRRYVFIPIWCMHRNPDYWERADEFLPERWLTHKVWKDSLADSYLPFGAGPRVCIGKRFALTEARVVLIELLKRAELAPLHPRAPKMRTWVLTRPARPVRLQLTYLDNGKQ